MLFKEIVDARTDARTHGRTTDAEHWRITKAHLSTLCSGELIKSSALLSITTNYHNIITMITTCIILNKISLTSNGADIANFLIFQIVPEQRRFEFHLLWFPISIVQLDLERGTTQVLSEFGLLERAWWGSENYFVKYWHTVRSFLFVGHLISCN